MPSQDLEPDTERVLADIGELKNDVEVNIQTLTGIADIGDLTKHLKETLWPTLESIVDRLSDLASVVDTNEEALLELAEDRGDSLTPETSKDVLGVLVVAAYIAEALGQRITPADPPELKKKLADFQRDLARVTELVQDATLDADDADEDEDDK